MILWQIVKVDVCDISHFEIAESDKEGTSLVSGCDAVCEHKNSKFAGTNRLTNGPATWPCVVESECHELFSLKKTTTITNGRSSAANST